MKLQTRVQPIGSGLDWIIDGFTVIKKNLRKTLLLWLVGALYLLAFVASIILVSKVLNDTLVLIVVLPLAYFLAAGQMAFVLNFVRTKEVKFRKLVEPITDFHLAKELVFLFALSYGWSELLSFIGDVLPTPLLMHSFYFFALSIPYSMTIVYAYLLIIEHKYSWHKALKVALDAFSKNWRPIAFYLLLVHTPFFLFYIGLEVFTGLFEHMDSLSEMILRLTPLESGRHPSPEDMNLLIQALEHLVWILTVLIPIFIIGALVLYGFTSFVFLFAPYYSYTSVLCLSKDECEQKDCETKKETVKLNSGSLLAALVRPYKLWRLNYSQGAERVKAIKNLAYDYNSEVVSELIDVYKAESGEAKAACLKALIELQHPTSKSFFMQLLSDKDSNVRLSGVLGLKGVSNDEDVYKRLRILSLKDSSEDVIKACHQILRKDDVR